MIIKHQRFVVACLYLVTLFLGLVYVISHRQEIIQENGEYQSVKVIFNGTPAQNVNEREPDTSTNMYSLSHVS